VSAAPLASAERYDRTVVVDGAIPTPQQILATYERESIARKPTLWQRIVSWFRSAPRGDAA
jgi:hypothetical protein